MSTLGRSAAAELLQAIPTPAVIHRGGVVVTANAAGRALFGFEAGEPMDGFNLFANLTAEELADFTLRRHAEYANCTPGTNTSWAHFDLKTRQDRRISVAFTCAQTLHEGQESVLSFFVDETPDLALDHALRYSQEVAVVATDEFGRVLWANPASERLNGYPASEMLGRTPGSVLQCERTDRAEVARLGRHLRAGSAVVCELLNRHKLGHEYWVRLQILPSHAPDGRLIGYIGLQTDVTEEVTRRRAHNAARDRLLATFSHEARTPLNAVMNLLDLLGDAPLEARHARWLRHAVEASQALRDLVTTVLDNSRQSHLEQTAPLRPARMAELMRRVQVISAAYPQHAGVQLHFDIPADVPAVMTRPDLLQRVLLNLVSNALKYTHQGEVQVRAEASTQGNSAVLRFSVTDTGIGIAPEDQARVLRPFETVEAAQSAGRDSTGLGLDLCEQMLRALGSSLRLYSLPGVGSCFSFELQVAVAAADADTTTATALPSLEGLRVILVDDDPVSLLVAEAQLLRLGADVSPFGDPRQALAELQRRGAGATDVVLCDLQMPVMDGVQLAQQVRALPGFERQVVVALSGEVEPAALARAGAAGISGFVEKPFDAYALASALSPHRQQAPA